VIRVFKKLVNHSSRCVIGFLVVASAAVHVVLGLEVGGLCIVFKF
jgi:hypothetical protein